MSTVQLLKRNLIYYWRTNLSVVLGVAAAVAVVGVHGRGHAVRAAGVGPHRRGADLFAAAGLQAEEHGRRYADPAAEATGRHLGQPVGAHSRPAEVARVGFGFHEGPLSAPNEKPRGAVT